MKSFSIYTAVAILAAALSYAAPVELESRNNAVTITFQGAPPNVAFYTRSIPIDGSVVELKNVLSISHIVGAAGTTCTFFGIDGSETTVTGANTVDVGPPQTQLRGSCKPS